ncbi:hypothetical protein CCS38_10015 [Streptomyces purpurogeneiscleroticus]|nr:hypothetical protein [Streptomyces purpurogeneiscleroticus]
MPGAGVQLHVLGHEYADSWPEAWRNRGVTVRRSSAAGGPALLSGGMPDVAPAQEPVGCLGDVVSSSACCVYDISVFADEALVDRCVGVARHGALCPSG